MLSITLGLQSIFLSQSSLAGPGSETRVWLMVTSARLHNVLLTTSPLHLLAVVAPLSPHSLWPCGVTVLPAAAPPAGLL